MAKVNDASVYIGSPTLFQTQLGLSLTDVSETISRLQGEGKTVVIIGNESGAWDQRRYATMSVQTPLADQGFTRSRTTRLVMLSGDNERTAAAIAKEVGIDEFYADLKPEDKVNQSA